MKNKEKLSYVEDSSGFPLPPKTYSLRRDLETHQRSFKKVKNVSTMLRFDLEELSLLVEFDSGVTSIDNMPQVEPFVTGELTK